MTPPQSIKKTLNQSRSRRRIDWASGRRCRYPVVLSRIMIFFITVIATLNLVLGYFLAVYLGAAEPNQQAAADAPSADESADDSQNEAAPATASPFAASIAQGQQAVAPPASPSDEQRTAVQSSDLLKAPFTPVASAPDESAANDEADLLAGIESFRAQLAESNPTKTDQGEIATTNSDAPVASKAASPVDEQAAADKVQAAHSPPAPEAEIDDASTEKVADAASEEVAIVATEAAPSEIAEAETAKEDAVQRDEVAIESSEADGDAYDQGGDLADEVGVADAASQETPRINTADAEIAEGLAAFRQQLATMKQGVGAEEAATT